MQHLKYWWELFIVHSTGSIVLVIQIPAEGVADVTWAGPNYDVLIATTWSTVLDPNTAKFYNGTISPDSGRVFSITGLNARGFPANAICIWYTTNVDAKQCC